MERKSRHRRPQGTGVRVQSPPPHMEQAASQRNLEDGIPATLEHLGLVQKQCGTSKTCSWRNAAMSWLPKVSALLTSGQVMVCWVLHQEGWTEVTLRWTKKLLAHISYRSMAVSQRIRPGYTLGLSIGFHSPHRGQQEIGGSAEPYRCCNDPGL